MRILNHPGGFSVERGLRTTALGYGVCYTGANVASGLCFEICQCCFLSGKMKKRKMLLFFKSESYPFILSYCHVAFLSSWEGGFARARTWVRDWVSAYLLVKESCHKGLRDGPSDGLSCEEPPQLILAQVSPVSPVPFISTETAL